MGKEIHGQHSVLTQSLSLCPLILSPPLWQCVGSTPPLTQRGQRRLTGLGWQPSTVAPPTELRQRWPRQTARQGPWRRTVEQELATSIRLPTGSWCAAGLWWTKGVWLLQPTVWQNWGRCIPWMQPRSRWWWGSTTVTTAGTVKVYNTWG